MEVLLQGVPAQGGGFKLGRLESWHLGDLVDDRLTDSLTPTGPANPGTVDQRRYPYMDILNPHRARNGTSEQLGR